VKQPAIFLGSLTHIGQSQAKPERESCEVIFTRVLKRKIFEKTAKTLSSHLPLAPVKNTLKIGSVNPNFQCILQAAFSLGETRGCALV
jgi:hypothetical protein